MNKTLYIFLSFIMFVYLALRAIYVPLVHDEIATFFYYIQPFDFNPLSGAHGDANNHILNSFLSGISYKLIGFSPFSLRLPNIVSFLIYAFFVFKIGSKLKKPITTRAYYLSMLFSIYFIQFFALTRGYGMSMAFLLGGIYFCLQVYEKKSISSIVLSSICLLLAIYANMSLLPLALLLFLILLVLVLKEKKLYSDIKSISIIGVAAAVTLFFIVFAVVISFKMKNDGLLYYGNLDGYWVITVKSQLLMLFENSGLVLQAVLFSILVGMMILYGFIFKKERNSFIFKKENLFIILLVGVVIGTFLMAQLLGVNYPEDRVGIYLYPLFIGSICFVVDRFKVKLSWLLLVPLFAIPLHFIYAFNFDKTSIWKQDKIPNRFYETIKNTKTSEGYPASVGGDELRLFVYTEKINRDRVKTNQLQFWNRTIFDSNLNLIPENHPGKYYDYLITNSPYIKDIILLYDSVDVSDISGHALFKRKTPSIKRLLDSKENHLDGETSQEYFEILHETYDSLGVDAVMVGLNLEIQSLKHPFTSRVVVEARDKETGEVLNYQYFQLNWLSNKIVSKNPIIKSLYLHNLPKFSEVEIVVYLWNINKKPYSIYKGKSEVYKVY